jgi:DNA (cytosine-5)-methyltransferase 3A
MNVFSAFDGHSGGRIALDVLGIKPTKYYASEVDKYAEKLSECCYPGEIDRMGSIMNWREWLIDWATIDLFIGGSPCQGFSMAGKMAGTAAILDGEKHIVDSREKYLELKEAGAEFLSQSFLFWEYVLLLDHVKQCNPKVKFFLENVKMKKEFLNLITDAIGVEPTFINSALLSAQNRQRWYWCNWGVIQPEDKGIVLADILECDVNNEIEINSPGWHRWFEGKKEFQIKKKYSVICNDGSTEKAIPMTARQYASWNGNFVEVKCAAQRGRYNDNGKIQQQFEVRKDDKTNSLTTVQKDNFVMQRVATASDIKGHDYNKRIYSSEGKSPSLAAASGGNLEPKVSIQKSETDCLKSVHYRKLTPRECGRLQTIPEHIIDKMLNSGVSNSQIYKALGNGWTIDVIAHIFSQMEIPIQVYARQLSLFEDAA